MKKQTSSRLVVGVGVPRAAERWLGLRLGERRVQGLARRLVLILEGAPPSASAGRRVRSYDIYSYGRRSRDRGYYD